MAEFKLTLVPCSGDFQVLDILLLDHGLIEPRSLDECPMPCSVDWERGIVLNGRAPVWLYAHLVVACGKAPWTAVFDPRVGGVIVASKVSQRRCGDVIGLDELLPWLPRHPDASKHKTSSVRHASRAIAVVGPPHSGKSVFLSALSARLYQHYPVDQMQRELFLLRACPDGEGAWSSQSQHTQELRYKGRWDDEFVQMICDKLGAIRRSKRLVLVDCGGIIDRYNQRIWNQCTHAILVARETALFSEWRGAVRASGLRILAAVETSLEVKCQIEAQTTPLALRLGPTAREQSGPEIPSELCEVLVGDLFAPECESGSREGT